MNELFRELPSTPELEKTLTTPDRMLRKELKDICEVCGKVVYEGPNVQLGHAKFRQHWKEEHAGTE